MHSYRSVRLAQAAIAVSVGLRLAGLDAGLAADPGPEGQAENKLQSGATCSPALKPNAPQPGARQHKRSLAKPGIEERWLDRWRSLPPEERQAKLKELRQKYGFGPPPPESVPKWHETWEAADRAAIGRSPESVPKWHETWEKLSPEQRRARLAEWQQQRAAAPLLTPKERQLHRQRLNERLNQAIATLRHKASNNLITIEEKNRLDRLEELARRFKANIQTVDQQPQPDAEAAGASAGSQPQPTKPNKADSP